MLEKIKNYSSALIVLLYIIIIPIIIYDLILIVQDIVNPNSTPNIFGYKTFTIVSESMKPTFEINDVILVKKCDTSELAVGDIITYIQNNDIITHRINKVVKNEGEVVLITKGDANNVTDISKVSESQIEGKYICKISKLGKLLNILKNKIVFSIVLIILIVIYLIEKNKISKKIKRKEKREKYERRKKLKSNTL